MTKPRQEFRAITVSLEALKQARKVAKKRKESVSYYVSSLILKNYD